MPADMQIDLSGLTEAETQTILSLDSSLQRGDPSSLWIIEKKNILWSLRMREPSLQMSIDFDSPGPLYRRKALRGGKELIAKALGKVQDYSRVLDLSAGLGQDAVFMCQLGYRVTAIERHPLLSFFLQQALQQSARADLQALHFVFDDAKKWAHRADEFDVVYFDPMYPEKKKSALARQEMRLFRQLVGDDNDSAEVIQGFFKNDWKRIVVKRPLRAEPLVSGFQIQFVGQTVRYDVYSRPRSQ